MHAKLILVVAAAIVLTATSGTATATNDPELTYPTGTLLSPGTSLKGLGAGTTLITASTGAIEACPRLNMTATLTENNGSEVVSEIESFTLSECVTTTVVNTNPAINGLPWCFSSTSTMATDEFQIRGGSCANEPRPIRIELKGCVYERPASKPITGTYMTHPNVAQLALSNVEFAKLSFFCFSPTSLDMLFGLYTDTEPANSVYIS